MESSPSSSFTSSSIQIGVLYIFISAFQLVASNCPSPSVPFANAHNGSIDTVYPPGTTLTYTCLTGFTSDDKYRICQMDGYWTGNDKVCKLNFISFFVALMSAVESS
ncbi:complement component receptor 1-like protein isoform X2 [Amphiura filiformis]|uniref:complement component receptor 1-like protein isoform X2 n=1 Tax=Amphiura filiformis TaxID=82378 RepID=UPI003B221669